MPEKDEANESRKPGSRLGMITALVVGLPLFYFLSLGPVFAVMNKTRGFDGKISWHAVETVYAPIIWLYENTSLKHPIEMYLQLWGLK